MGKEPFAPRGNRLIAPVTAARWDIEPPPHSTPMIYLISYDLNNAKNYETLKQRIEELFPQRRRVLYSEWLVESASSPIEIANSLLSVMDGDDGILVTELTKRTAWRSLQVSDEIMWKWINAANP